MLQDGFGVSSFDNTAPTPSPRHRLSVHAGEPSVAKMCSPQTRRDGSSRLPAEIEMCRPCVGAQNSCDPQAEQKPRRAVGDDRYHLRVRPVVSRSEGAQAV